MNGSGLAKRRIVIMMPRMTLDKLSSWACGMFLMLSSLTSNAGDASGWKPLFNGKNLEGWNNPYSWGKFQMVDGEVHLTADKKFFLVTDKKYSDFILEGEILLPAGKANSGFMFRCHAEKDKVYGYQAEVDGSDRCWSGGLYDEGRRGWLWPSKAGRTKEESALKHEKSSQEFMAKPEIKNALKRDEWNTYRVTCKGDHIRIEVNGVLVTDYHDSTDAEGYIGIQHHGEKGQTYKFRNLRIKELK